MATRFKIASAAINASGVRRIRLDCANMVRTVSSARLLSQARPELVQYSGMRMPTGVCTGMNSDVTSCAR